MLKVKLESLVKLGGVSAGDCLELGFEAPGGASIGDCLDLETHGESTVDFLGLCLGKEEFENHQGCNNRMVDSQKTKNAL